jgi:hypothetical protein
VFTDIVNFEFIEDRNILRFKTIFEGPGIWWRTKDIYFLVLVGRKLEKQRDE